MRRLKQFITHVRKRKHNKILYINTKYTAKIHNPCVYSYDGYTEYCIGYHYSGNWQNVVIISNNRACLYSYLTGNNINIIRLSKGSLSIINNNNIINITILDKPLRVRYSTTCIILAIGESRLISYCKMIDTLLERASQFKL